MSLDLTRVASQVGNMLSRLKTGLAERQEHLNNALDTIGSQAENIDALRKKIAVGKTALGLVADLVDGLDGHYPPPPLPAEFTVMATDGSHIDVDRHRSARCFLINIGSVVLRYGASPDAALESHPTLYADEEELVITPTGPGREQPIEGTLLGVRRSVDECRKLAELAAEQPAGSASLALVDGTLILWGLDSYPDFVSEQLIDKGFLSFLSNIRKLNEDRKVSVASYISLPRATDVVNALRVAICPHDPPDCNKYCPGGKRDCDTVAGVRDREIFDRLLGPGERSDLFISQVPVVNERYGEHRVYFFYIKLEDEIVRVELPEWAARNGELLGLTHALVLDQCDRGHGYPVALAEAHEQAVVTVGDRDNFWYLVDTSLVDEHMPTPTSGKDRSKKTRWV